MRRNTSPLRGLANLNVVADDVPAAIDWYTRVFGEAPYFVRPETGEPQYAEWRFGDDADEFAVMSSAFRPSLAAPGGALASIHVDDIRAAFDWLVGLGARPADPIVERGGGFWSASIADPFGNLIGLIQSPHWRDAHAR
ncbi:VOC family protein [Microbacterium stercoris]|uniref:VOC family protein n=1 Tax=Microbacterium stercoris TaxID=2820289 RepID=A0A939QQZ3_9MICO|nr:VOC family protein [Microbacterium stercoris]MBO3663041.1 VOC family protein [Microbacterium stercoris]